jgi:hypothetical protein
LSVVRAVALLALAGLTAGCRGRTATADPPQLCALTNRVELRGFFSVEYGDPPAGSSGGTVRYVLATEQGTAKVMLVDAHQLDPLGSPTSLNGRRVIVSADTMVARKDTVHVCAIRLAAEDRRW